MKGLRAGAAIVCLLPWADALPLAPAWFHDLVGLTFLPLCHHWAGRVLVLRTGAMCVCSRCAGLYAGLALGFALSLPSLATRTYARLSGLAMALMLADVVTQDLGLHAPSHVTRLATGAMVGWTVGAWMVTATARSRPSPASSRRG